MRKIKGKCIIKILKLPNGIKGKTKTKDKSIPENCKEKKTDIEKAGNRRIH